MPQAIHWLFPFIHGLGLGVVSMLLHECGHLVAAILLGVRVKKIGMKWNKGFYIVRQNGTDQQNLLIALAGPFTNLLLISTYLWAPLFGIANFCYALANMLPIEGSDGYRIAWCWRQIRLARVREQ
jgi:Zn-dependent protease